VLVFSPVHPWGSVSVATTMTEALALVAVGIPQYNFPARGLNRR